MVLDSAKHGTFSRFLTLGVLPSVVVISCLWYTLFGFGSCNSTQNESNDSNGLKTMPMFLTVPGQRVWQTLTRPADSTTQALDTDSSHKIPLADHELEDSILSSLNLSLARLKGAIAEDSRRALEAVLEKPRGFGTINTSSLSFPTLSNFNAVVEKDASSDVRKDVADAVREVLREEASKRRGEDALRRGGGEGGGGQEGPQISEALRELKDVLSQQKGVVMSQQGSRDDMAVRGSAIGLPDVRIKPCLEGGGRKLAGRTWTPREGKYLLVTCTFSQMSNRMMCIRNYLLAAFVLGCTLIMPTEDLTSRGYDFSVVFDVPRARGCFGPKTVFTLAEYLQMEGGGSNSQLKVDRVVCWLPNCFKPQLKPTHPRIVFPPPEESGLKNYCSEDEFLAALGGVDAKVLSLGDVFGGGMSGFPAVKHDGVVPFQSECSLLMYPHKAVLETALAFARTFLGEGYAAFHWRRGDFYHFCSSKNFSCYWPTPRVAEALLDTLIAHRIELLYLATNAGREEVDLLSSILINNKWNFPVQVVRLPEIIDQPWTQAFQGAHMVGKGPALAMLDKAICAMSRIFISSPSSTFSWDTKALRRGFQKRSCHDHDIGTKTWLPFLSGSDASNSRHEDEFQGVSMGLGF